MPSHTCHVPSDAEAQAERAELDEMLDLLDDRQRRHFMADLAWAARHQDQTGDERPFAEILTGLTVTASLLRNPDYREAAEQARTTPAGEPVEDLGKYVASIRKR